MSIYRPVLKRAGAAACAVVIGMAALLAQQPPPKPAVALNDLDGFMAKVLEKRNENWRTLHDYILSERETFEVLGPLDIPLHALRREFQWFIRDGYLVRSPVKSNGVSLSAAERKKYEDKWLEDEKKRDKEPEDAEAKRKAELSISVRGDVEFSGFASQGAEPRFISEAYFMKFKFEPGNYYFAGREQLDGREVLKVEYLPSKLFNDEEPSGSAGSKAKGESKSESKPESKPAAQPAAKPASGDTGKAGRKPSRKPDKDDKDEDEKLDRAMNKTSTVTMWIDPQEYQIVRFTFDNVDWGFLPGRQIVRVDEARASMTMGRVFEHIWLPRDVTFKGAATFAAGTLRFQYGREFYDYRRGEVSAKIRGYVPKEPKS